MGFSFLASSLGFSFSASLDFAAVSASNALACFSIFLDSLSSALEMVIHTMIYLNKIHEIHLVFAAEKCLMISLADPLFLWK